MSFDKRFHRLFPSDFATATAYYDKISVDLGFAIRFVMIVDRPAGLTYPDQTD